MTSYRIKKVILKGEITIPPSKSQTLRSILFGCLGSGKSIVRHYLQSNDADAMVEACRLFGAQIDIFPEKIEIQGLDGKIEQTEDVIDAGNSGIVLRFCSAVGALSQKSVVITGDYSVRHQRPMSPLLEGLRQLGVSALSMRDDDHAPVIVKGPLKSGKAVIEGADSQPVSALLIASTFANGPIELTVCHPGEKPWVALTLEWFDRLGISYTNREFKHYSLYGNSHYEGFEYSVPGDFSSAAFPIAAALITHSEIVLKNIDMKDSQGDKELIDVFIQMGAIIEIEEKDKTLRVKKGKGLKGVRVDINNFVDAITILAVVSCFAEGETLIHNAAIAKKKECNRIYCIANELKKMGADIVETEDGLCIKKSRLQGCKVESYHDHRMAMSLVVAGLGASGETLVSSVECISKTFPTFKKDFNILGAAIDEIQG